jgi:hypothetical protein
MKCMDCPVNYEGETGRIFYTIYKEHVQTIKNNKGNSGYLKHLLSTGCTHGSIAITMNIIKNRRRETPKYTRKIPHI